MGPTSLTHSTELSVVVLPVSASTAPTRTGAHLLVQGGVLACYLSSPGTKVPTVGDVHRAPFVIMSHSCVQLMATVRSTWLMSVLGNLKRLNTGCSVYPASPQKTRRSL